MNVQTNTGGDLSNDALRLVHAATVAHMSKPERVQYLRSRGWRRVEGSGKQWQSRNGVTASLAGAVQLQAMADLET